MPAKACEGLQGAKRMSRPQPGSPQHAHGAVRGRQLAALPQRELLARDECAGALRGAARRCLDPYSVQMNVLDIC